MRLAERIVALACFLLLILPLVAYCAWTVPLGQAPDEPTHIARADSVLRGEVMGYRGAHVNAASGGADAGVTANFGLVYAASLGNGAMAPPSGQTSTRARVGAARAVPWWPAPMFISSVNTAAYAPVAYMPAALALGIAESMGATPYGAGIGARFGNVLAFALLGCLALTLAGRGRLLLLLTLALPMTVWLAGSCNQDGLLIAVAVLALALLTRSDGRGFWAGTALLAVLALQKPPFAALMLLPLIAPAAAGRPWRPRAGAAVLVALPAALWSVAVMRHVSVPLLPGAPYHPGPLWPGDPSRIFRSAIPGAQMAVVLHHPLAVARLCVTETIRQIPVFRLELIGILGSIEIRLPAWLYSLFSLGLLSAMGELIAGTRGTAGLRIAGRVTAAFAALGCAVLILLVQYLTWTPVGFARIDGVQGRYFIPLLPVLILILPRILALPARLGWIWWIAPVAAIIAADVTLPGIIAQHYYR